MKTTFTLLLSVFWTALIHAQVTLSFSAPNDSFNLACPSCTLTVTGISIFKGQQAMPVDLQNAFATNLLYWRAYDKVLEKDVLTAHEPAFRQSVQLLDEIADTTLLSLHLNLGWADSTGRAQRIFLVVSGITKPDLRSLPLKGLYDEDPYLSRRFSAVVEIKTDAVRRETYDCIYGECSLNALDPKTGAVNGTFEFTGNRIGLAKRGFFTQGRFQQ